MCVCHTLQSGHQPGPLYGVGCAITQLTLVIVTPRVHFTYNTWAGGGGVIHVDNRMSYGKSFQRQEITMVYIIWGIYLLPGVVILSMVMK